MPDGKAGRGPDALPLDRPCGLGRTASSASRVRAPIVRLPLAFDSLDSPGDPDNQVNPPSSHRGNLHPAPAAPPWWNPGNLNGVRTDGPRRQHASG